MHFVLCFHYFDCHEVIGAGNNFDTGESPERLQLADTNRLDVFKIFAHQEHRVGAECSVSGRSVGNAGRGAAWQEDPLATTLVPRHSFMDQIARIRCVCVYAQFVVLLCPVDVAHETTFTDDFGPFAVVMLHHAVNYPFDANGTDQHLSVFHQCPFTFERLWSLAIAVGNRPALKHFARMINFINNASIITHCIKIFSKKNQIT
mmetsp:Transcript_2923/g.4685  ORF Transcript_2923/g.4685 Transcript_2923/m.4685 type:complete len:204 (+) Transcript_2923:118-729(+)